MGNLAKRLATAAVLVPLVLVAIYLDPTPWGVTALAVVVAMLAYDEYLRMAFPASADDSAWVPRAIGGAFAAAFVITPVLWSLSVVLPPLLLAAVPTFGAVVLFRRAHLDRAGHHFAIMLAGLVYVPLMVALLALFKAQGHPHWLVVVLCIAFFSDTVAYFFGRAWGRHRLYPAVSPKKTIEGAVGGVLGGMLAAGGVGSLWLTPEVPLGLSLALGAFASVAGQTGDLVESMIKRTHGVKDSGNVLPGHGGMLDRIDALVFVTPVVFAFLRWS